jgi:hypothetical protein
VEAALEADDARVTLQQLGYDPAGTLSVHVTTDGVDLTREHVASAAPHVHVDANGAFVDVPPPAGSWLERGHLRVRDLERPIALGPGHDPLGHPHVARTPDGRWALVFTEVAGCHEVAFTRHVLDRVDLVHGRVTRLSAAPTHAGVALGTWSASPPARPPRSPTCPSASASRSPITIATAASEDSAVGVALERSQ